MPALFFRYDLFMRKYDHLRTASGRHIQSHMKHSTLVATLIVTISLPAFAGASEDLKNYGQCAVRAVATGGLVMMDTLPVTSIISSAFTNSEPADPTKELHFFLADMAGGALTFFFEAYVYSLTHSHSTKSDVSISQTRSLVPYRLSAYPYKSSAKYFRQSFRSSDSPCQKK